MAFHRHRRGHPVCRRQGARQALRRSRLLEPAPGGPPPGAGFRPFKSLAGAPFASPAPAVDPVIDVAAREIRCLFIPLFLASPLFGVSRLRPPRPRTGGLGPKIAASPLFHALPPHVSTHALRHHRPALRQRHRSTSATSMEYIQADIWVRNHAHGGPHGALRGRRRRARRADHARRPRREGITPQRAGGRYAAERPQYLNGFHIALRPLAFHRHAREHRAVAQDIYRALQGPGADRRRAPSSSSTTRSRACSWPTATSRANARTATQGPVRRLLRGLRRGLRAHRADQPLLGADRAPRRC